MLILTTQSIRELLIQCMFSVILTPCLASHDEDLQSLPSENRTSLSSSPRPTAQSLGPSSHSHKKITIISISTAGVGLLLVIIALLFYWVYRRKRQRDSASLTSQQAHGINEQTRQQSLSALTHATTVRPVSSSVQSARPARQGVLEHRLVTLEQEVRNLTTTLSSLETRIPREQSRFEDRMTTNDLSKRFKPICRGSMDQQRQLCGAEGRTDLPPEYRLEDI